MAPAYSEIDTAMQRYETYENFEKYFSNEAVGEPISSGGPDMKHSNGYQNRLLVVLVVYITYQTNHV